MSLFSALNTASSGLAAQQRAIDVTGQNVANVNTDGYSRQRVNMQAVGGTAVPAIWSVSNQVGSGVDASDVIRIRDAFLEAQGQQAHSAVANLTVQDATYTAVQQAFGEPGDTGIQSLLSGEQGFWNSFGDIHSNPQDEGARTQLIQRAQNLTAGLHSAMGTLDKQWSESRDTTSTLVTDVNSTTKQIADLNRSIQSAAQAGQSTNELADKRDSLVMHLADQIGATSSMAPDGTMTVSVGGISLVSGIDSIQVKVTGAQTAADATTSPVALVTSPGGAKLQAGGTAQGQLTSLNSIIPGYEQQLNGVANLLADQVNTVQEQGYDLTGAPGAAFFTNGGGTAPVDARNITVGITDYHQVAAASLSTTDTGGAVSSDGNNADALYELRNGITQPDGTVLGPDTSYRSMIVGLGVQAAGVSSSLQTNTTLSTNVDANRESVSGVNTDEEMTNMLQYQHAYAAAGQLVSTINSMMDTLINMVQG